MKFFKTFLISFSLFFGIFFVVPAVQALIIKNVPISITVISSNLDKLNIIAIPEKRVGVARTNDSNKLRVKFQRSSSFTLLQSVTANSATNGVYGNLDVSTLAQGYFDLFVKGTSHLTKKLTNFSLDTSVTEVDFTNNGTDPLLAGDINGVVFGDDVINSIDLSILINDLDAFDLRSDLNRDNIVNALDLSILITNLDKSGET